MLNHILINKMNQIKHTRSLVSFTFKAELFRLSWYIKMYDGAIF